MKKTLLIIVCLFVGLSVYGQDNTNEFYNKTHKEYIDMFLPNGVENNGKIELEFYNLQGNRIALPSQGYVGIVAMVVKDDGKVVYVKKLKFDNKEEDFENMKNEIVSIYQKIMKKRNK